jgi:hypothetical protein
MTGLIWILSWATQTSSEHGQSLQVHPVKKHDRENISYSCEQNAWSGVRVIIAASKSCITDEDCVLIEGEGCPYGCGVAVNKQSKHVALSAIREFVDFKEEVCGSICYQRCFAVDGAICKQQKCESVSGVKNPPPLDTEPPPMPNYEGET